MKRVKEKGTHGGRREGSGRASFFRGKSGKAEEPLYGDTPPAQNILLTRKAFTQMKSECKRLSREYGDFSGKRKARISRNVFIEALIRIYGSRLTFHQIQREDAHG